MAKIKESELKLIKELEKEIGMELPEIPIGSILKSGVNGYAVDEDGNVVELVLDGNESETIPSNSLKFEHLKGVSLHDNNISDISLLEGLSQLTTLNLSSNYIDDFSVLEGLKHLTTLNLSENNSTDISVLEGLRQLTTLGLSSTGISDISVMEGLRQLTTLDLSYNGISDFAVLEGLKHLRTLDLSYNGISDFAVLEGLRQLTALNLSDNEINDISGLEGLRQLTILSLEHNQITTLPETMLELDMEIDVGKAYGLKDGRLYLFGNPLESPPPEIIRQGKDAIRDYFKSIKKGKELPLNEVKVLLVGDGGAGKTSLVKCLRGIKFDKKEPQTHGINIDLWPVKCGDTEITTRLWDFGGQEIMHATHQFFLSKRSLYILVLDGRKEEKTEYWLKHIKSFGGDSPVLVVLNKIDENPGFEVNRKFLLGKYPNIKGFYRVSCAEGDGMKDFSKALKQAIDSVEIKSTRWGEAWFRVKKKLEKMEEDFIGYNQYRKICEDAKVPDDSGRDTLVEFLNDLGVIVHFKDMELNDTHVLQPRWVTTAVYKIINSGILTKDEGILFLDKLKYMLKKRDKKDYFYPPQKYRFIIELMKKFELCYTLDNKRLLVPSLLEVDEPDFPFDYQGALAVIMQYDFLPPSIILRFIVKMHRDIYNGLQWRTGVVLADTDFDASAVVKTDQEAKRIYFYVNGLQKRDYLTVLLTVLRHINQDFQKLKPIERVPMPDDPEITVNYKHLLRLEQRGIDIYLPGESEKEYNVKSLLGSVKVDNRSEQELLKLIRKAVRDDDIEESVMEKVNDTLLDAFKFNPRILGLEVDINAILKKLRSKKK